MIDLQRATAISNVRSTHFWIDLGSYCLSSIIVNFTYVTGICFHILFLPLVNQKITPSLQYWNIPLTAVSSLLQEIMCLARRSSLINIHIIDPISHCTKIVCSITNPIVQGTYKHKYWCIIRSNFSLKGSFSGIHGFTKRNHLKSSNLIRLGNSCSGRSF